MRHRQSGKSNIILILFTLFFLALMSGAGYVGIRLWWIENQPRSALGAVKVNGDVLRWAYGNIPDLYAQIVALDDIITLLEKELNRLKDLARTYPDQQTIVSEESERLTQKKGELTDILSEAVKAVEAIYVSYKIDARKGQAKIGSKETYDLDKHLKSTLKSSRSLVRRISSQNPENWIDKVNKAF